MTPTSGTSGAARRIAAPPSMVQLATQAVRDMILSGELRPGDRVVENRLTQQLGVSRAPLREALRMLEHEGLIVQHARRGAVVTPLTQHDVYEIVTLRRALERLAVQLGVPVRSPQALDRCRAALGELEAAAASGDEPATTTRGFDFHLAIVGLAGHRRLEESYRTLSLQIQLCMGLNRSAMRPAEDLAAHAARHRRLLDTIEKGDRAAVQEAMERHGHHTFLLDVAEQFEGASPESQAWLEGLKGLDGLESGVSGRKQPLQAPRP